ncbi:Oidioi.mRNA.OKI2018_I69.PAR.g9218.t1.cds [Oikopleura dioica]|uniref:Oidioi.mRNA.OKI2018_I69.PAR.g9218.t1.cds n=1 Tax=Oikopleura dioica TaxID=34765 RepID=A0ABN7RNR5_OIKDI|nr:Oidioi.mRNA.OKI2018_I69.PAR.g9218.t1.cds [Oikopleura dioica]
MMIRAELGIYFVIITCYAVYEFSGLIAFSVSKSPRLLECSASSSIDGILGESCKFCKEEVQDIRDFQCQKFENYKEQRKLLSKRKEITTTAAPEFITVCDERLCRKIPAPRIRLKQFGGDEIPVIPNFNLAGLSPEDEQQDVFLFCNRTQLKNPIDIVLQSIPDDIQSYLVQSCKEELPKCFCITRPILKLVNFFIFLMPISFLLVKTDANSIPIKMTDAVAIKLAALENEFHPFTVKYRNLVQFIYAGSMRWFIFYIFLASLKEIVIHTEVQFAAPLWVHKCRGWDLLFALVGLIRVGVVYLRLDAVVSTAKPNGSFVAPTSISKENRKKKFLDSTIIISLIIMFFYNILHLVLAGSAMSISSCIFHREHRAEMTRHQWYFEPLTKVIMEKGVEPCQIYMGALVIFIILPILCCLWLIFETGKAVYISSSQSSLEKDNIDGFRITMDSAPSSTRTSSSEEPTLYENF